MSEVKQACERVYHYAILPPCIFIFLSLHPIGQSNLDETFIYFKQDRVQIKLLLPW